MERVSLCNNVGRASKGYIVEGRDLRVAVQEHVGLQGGVARGGTLFRFEEPPLVGEHIPPTLAVYNKEKKIEGRQQAPKGLMSARRKC